MHSSILPSERIESKIFVFRGVKVMMARDLALLYGVETKILNQAANRNRDRFPEDFMFQLTKDEAEIWRSQIVISKSDKTGNLRSQIVTSRPEWGGDRYAPYAFTEQGVAMLSSVLKSKRAILVNIQIIRTFTKLRELVSETDSLRLKLESLEKRFDEQFKVVFTALRRMLEGEDAPKTEIGFRAGD